MHMPIGIMVKAETRDDATGEIEAALDCLVGQGKPFDYYGDVIAVHKYSPKGGKGKKEVEDRLANNKSEFMDHMAVIREALAAATDEELYEKDFGNKMFRYHCYHAGEYGGVSCWLYTEWGSGIRNHKELEDALSEGREGFDWYIVIVDVHC